MARCTLLLSVALAALVLGSLAVAQANNNGAQKELESLVKSLNSKGYGKLVGALVATGLDKAILDLLKKGTKFTLLAPKDSAFARISKTCKFDLTQTLLDHALPGKYSANDLKALGNKKIQSLGKDKVGTVTKSPQLKLGLYTPKQKQVCRAIVVAPNDIWTTHVAVQGINGVLVSCK